MPNPIADPLVENVVAEDISELVRLEATPDGVVVVTLNRPDKANRFDGQTVTALREAFETLHGADHVRIVFLRGEGGDFCGGLDEDWMQVAADWTEADNRADALALGDMLKVLAETPALTVALVEGKAYGVGAGLAAVCDVAVATDDAVFAFPEVKQGLLPAMVAPYVVTAIGPRAAKTLFATGRSFDAAYAAAIGLVDEVVDGVEGLMAAQERLAAEMASAAPEAVREAKALAWDVSAGAHGRDMTDDLARRLARRRVSEEGREGVSALLAGRTPTWAG